MIVHFLFLLAVVSAVYSTPSSSPSFAKRAAVKKYCTPSSKPACWPTNDAWSAFNASVNGNLIQVTPWANPCFSNAAGQFDLLACQNIKLSYKDGFKRADQVGTAQLDNWAYCYTNQGEVGDCSIAAASLQGQLSLAPEPITRQCRLGRISPYAVAVQSAQDVQTALAFAKKNNIKVVIKNTGHEYLGRGTAPDTLMIWTHNLQSLTYNAAFTPQGGSQAVQAIVMGAGVQAEPAYRFAAQQGKDITLGAYGSVGVAGGFAQGGGHGPLQPKYGLAVDNIVQYTVVTADNAITVANAYQNSDLYFALRGGGGGTWGVLVETVYKAYDTVPVIGVVFNMTINPLYTYSQRLQAVADFTENLAAYEVDWRKKGWSGYVFVYTSYILFSHFLPGGTLADATSDMAQFLLYLQQRQATGQWIIPINLITPFPNFEACRELIFKNGESETPVAYSERLSSRLINVDQYLTPEKRKALGVAVAAAYDAANNNDGVPAQDLPFRAGNGIQLYSTGPLPTRFGGPTGADTGVNTACRDSIWEVVLFNSWTQGISQAGRNVVAQKTSKAMDSLRPMGTGTYFSEADVLEPNWQTAFFGGNYAKLVSIKKKWDPSNMFIVYKGIGYEGQESQAAFACYQQA